MGYRLLTALVATLASSAAQASILFSIQPTPAIASPGDSGDGFDVVVTNTGPNGIAIGGFSFEVTVASPPLNMTEANFSTVAAPYIFTGQSLDQDLSIPLNTTSGTTLDANDSSDASGATLDSGASLALGHVLFDVADNAALGPYAITFGIASGANSLSDPTGGNIVIDTFIPGEILVTPEPSSMMLILGFSLLGFIFRPMTVRPKGL